MAVYELAILGSCTLEKRDALTATLAEMLSDFDLVIGVDVIIHDAASVPTRDKKVAFAAAYFGPGDDQEGVISDLITSSAPVIPVVQESGDFVRDVPEALRAANGIRLDKGDENFTVLASAMLECVGLLRRQRRIFVSYRRPESRAAALQLHDQMTGRGFDVFLDTHDIRPGDPFQDVLWHRLCDSDVMIMLDTPSYFESRWTREELGKALAKEIHVLRIVWPEHKPTRMIDLAETIYLDPHELQGADGPLIDQAVDQIVLAAEKLRSRSIAARYMSFTGRIRADATKVGARIDGVGAHRAISILLNNGKRIWAYPVVGIPSAETLNDIAEKARRANQTGMPVLVYDSIGIRDAWSAHLQWLGDNIKTVQAMKLAEVAWSIAGMED
jgi:hypothetical protein